MKPAAFDYVRAGSVAEALAALADDDREARVLAGGQSLVPMMALRLARPEVLVDIARCPELQSYAFDGPVLRVGAAVPDAVLERDAEIGAAHPLLMRTLSLIAHEEIRARGTLCGSLAHADPAAELPALLLATDGEVEVDGPGGARRVPAADFFTGPFTPALDDGEMIVAARLPLPGPGVGWAVDEIARRPGDFALAGAVCTVELDDAGTCSRVGVALFGLASTPVRSRGAEEVLMGQQVDEAALDAAAAASLDGIDVIGDEVHASDVYRRSAGRALVRSTLAAAVRSAGGGRA
jgi:aerobic carbon-monoxide dehydrogenase medium subunit